jgi:hypothetical protein
LSEDIQNTVRGMAALVLNSNRISEVHEKSMKSYPFIYFDAVSAVKIDYDLTHESNVDLDKENNIKVKSPLKNCFVSYYLTLDESKIDQNLKVRFAALENSTRVLFWKDLPVKIYFNDRLVFESKKK